MEGIMVIVIFIEVSKLQGGRKRRELGKGGDGGNNGYSYHHRSE